MYALKESLQKSIKTIRNSSQKALLINNHSDDLNKKALKKE